MVKNEAPASICMFFTLFFIHSSWYCLREIFVLTSQHFIFSDHFINSRDLSVWSGSVNCWEKLNVGHYIWGLKGFIQHAQWRGCLDLFPKRLLINLKILSFQFPCASLQIKWQIWHKIRSHLGPFSMQLFIIIIRGNKGPSLLRERHSIC